MATTGSRNLSLRADALRNRERLVEVARLELAAGNVSLQLNDIARKAGVGVGTAYRHFPTPQALLEAVVGHELGQLVAVAKQALEIADPRKALVFTLNRALELQLGTDGGLGAVMKAISTSSSRHSAGRITIDDLNGENTRYRPFAAYGNWKLGNVLFTRELARRTEGTSITATAFHPGAVASDFFRNDGGPLATVLKSRIVRKLMITPDHGADPLVHLATLDNPRAVNGAYFDRLTHREPKGAQATDDDLARSLWDRTADLLK